MSDFRWYNLAPINHTHTPQYSCPKFLCYVKISTQIKGSIKMSLGLEHQIIKAVSKIYFPMTYYFIITELN
jgi:hypothetical protein